MNFSGLVLLLRWNIETNYGIDSDLLGFFWEMLNSKSTEKRILGAEASVALAPYISVSETIFKTTQLINHHRKS